jgi:glycosyltransferase involved in cell wall biosynthesis
LSEQDSAEALHRLEEEIARMEASERQRSMNGVILCIPALNKERQVREVVPSVVPHFRKVIVCDDGSIDETASVARKAGAFVMRHDERLGKSKTLSDLLEAAAQDNPEVVVIMELEGRNDPSSIPELLAPLLRNEADIATVVRETEKLRAKGGEFVALNAKALSARVRDDFFSSVSEGEVERLASVANLRFRIVTPRPRVYAPASPDGKPAAPGLKGRWARAQQVALVQRPSLYIGLTGIELSAAGLGLIILALFRNQANGSLDIPLVVIGGVALFLGVSMLIAYALIYTLQSLFRERGMSGTPPAPVERPSPSQRMDSPPDERIVRPIPVSAGR